MSNVIMLSDSDSEDLPFAERVQRLIHGEVKEEKRNPSPMKNRFDIHSISDSEDSRDTIPFSRDRSVSPVSSIPEIKKNDINEINSDHNLPDLSSPTFTFNRSISPVFSIPGNKKKDFNEINSDHDLPDLSPPKFTFNIKKLIQTPNQNCEKTDNLYDVNSDDSLPPINRGRKSPSFGFNFKKCDADNKAGDISSDDDLFIINHNNPSSLVVTDNNFRYDDVKKNAAGSGDKQPDLISEQEPIESEANVKKWDFTGENDDESSNDSFILTLKNKFPSTVPESSLDLKMRINAQSSDDNAPVVKNNKSSQEKRRKNEVEKEIKKKIRQEKKKEKEFEKALKASEKEILKNQKPEECLKNMKIVLDHNILYLEGSQNALNLLDQNNLKYSVEQNICKYSVNWYRNIINIATENNEIVKEEREELADTIIMIIQNEDFLKMIHAYVQKGKGKSSENVTLAEYVTNAKSLYPDCDVTYIIIGFQKYMRSVKEGSSFDLKTIAKQIQKNSSEEAIIELQLQSPVNFTFLEDMTEFGNLLHHFSKAIAEAPQRKEKQLQKSLAFSWYADIDSSCPVKLAKDKATFIKLWKQQIQQFHNVGPEVAEAIASLYPSPRLLMKAYKQCSTTKDAENLLQDIVIRRNYGPLGTQRRIGPELSYKMYLFFNCKDGSRLLKR